MCTQTNISHQRLRSSTLKSGAIVAIKKARDIVVNQTTRETEERVETIVWAGSREDGLISGAHRGDQQRLRARSERPYMVSKEQTIRTRQEEYGQT